MFMLDYGEEYRKSHSYTSAQTPPISAALDIIINAKIPIQPPDEED